VKGTASVILVRLSERQVDQVVHHPKPAEPDHDQRRRHVLGLDCRVITEAKFEKQSQRKVTLIHKARLEFVLELSELFRLSGHEQDAREENETRSHNCSDGTRKVTVTGFLCVIKLSYK
jgi:hypothetical protein